MATTLTAPSEAVEQAPGRTEITERTVQRIATHTVTEIDDVGGSGGRVLGIDFGTESLSNPAKVSVTRTGRTLALDVRLSVAYPISVAGATERARAHLTNRVEEFTGLTVSRVDITVTALPTRAATARRVQ